MESTTIVTTNELDATARASTSPNLEDVHSSQSRCHPWNSGPQGRGSPLSGPIGAPGRNFLGHDVIMATAHLIHGYLGAGKTSFAAHLEQVVGGIRFSVDEWYLRLYVGDEAPAHLEQAWWDRLSSLLDDFGFWTRHSRDNARALALAAGAETKLYGVVCADEVAKARCLSRNPDRGRSFFIDETAFEVLRKKFETC
jgi:predicted kinase